MGRGWAPWPLEVLGVSGPSCPLFPTGAARGEVASAARVLSPGLGCLVARASGRGTGRPPWWGPDLRSWAAGVSGRPPGRAGFRRDFLSQPGAWARPPRCTGQSQAVLGLGRAPHLGLQTRLGRPGGGPRLSTAASASHVLGPFPNHPERLPCPWDASRWTAVGCGNPAVHAGGGLGLHRGPGSGRTSLKPQPGTWAWRALANDAPFLSAEGHPAPGMRVSPMGTRSVTCAAADRARIRVGPSSPWHPLRSSHRPHWGPQLRGTDPARRKQPEAQFPARLGHAAPALAQAQAQARPPLLRLCLGLATGRRAALRRWQPGLPWLCWLGTVPPPNSSEMEVTAGTRTLCRGSGASSPLPDTPFLIPPPSAW